MDESVGHYAKQNKSPIEKQILWNLKMLNLLKERVECDY
jgi:hypothetical protein